MIVQTIDVGSTLDNAPWTVPEALIAATASTIIFDGLDNQLLNAALPTLMREWNLPRPAFVPAQTAGMIGMMIGGALGGVAGDRLGRRIALLGSVVAFGLLTMLVPLASGVGTLTVLRFFAGFGLGGAMPNAAALASEYVPKRKRPFAVTLTLVCIPLGGSLAGLIGGWVLPRFGWRALFFVGGVLPLLLAAALVKLLPESPRFLARRPERWPQLRAQLRRLGHQVSDDARFADVTEQAVAKVSARELLVPAYRRDTLALSASFFFCLLAVYMGVTWVPAVLTGAAKPDNTLRCRRSSRQVSWVQWRPCDSERGSRLMMLVMTAGVVLGAGVLATMSISPASSAILFAMLAWTGGLNNAVQTTMYALAAHVYPTAVRATGVGTAVAVGRIGGVLSPSFGSWALETGGSPRYFGLISATMALTFVALASIRRHIPGASPSQAAARRSPGQSADRFSKHSRSLLKNSQRHDVKRRTRRTRSEMSLPGPEQRKHEEKHEEENPWYSSVHLRVFVVSWLHLSRGRWRVRRDLDTLDGREANDPVVRSRAPRARRTLVAEDGREPSVLHRCDGHDGEWPARRLGLSAWLGRLRTPHAQADGLERGRHGPVAFRTAARKRWRRAAIIEAAGFGRGGPTATSAMGAFSFSTTDGHPMEIY